MGESVDIVRQPQLMLLGGFTLLHGPEEILLPLSVQRLVALLALRDRPLSRTHLASVLWPDCPFERSLADLRTVLWRARNATVGMLVSSGMCVRLDTQVQVDVRALLAWGRATADRTERSIFAEFAGTSWIELSRDLLPDWDDDWLVDDREDVRQLRFHALEHLSDELSMRGRHPEAIQTARAAVRLDPLRETAHAALIRAHLAEGNRSEALRQFFRCRAVLTAELAVEPSAWIRRLIPIPWLQDPDRHADLVEPMSKRVMLRSS